MPTAYDFEPNSSAYSVADSAIPSQRLSGSPAEQSAVSYPLPLFPIPSALLACAIKPRRTDTPALRAMREQVRKAHGL